MEISALPLPSPTRFPSPLTPFSDQSHVQFYGSVLRHNVPVCFFSHQPRRSLHSAASTTLNQPFAAIQFVGGACPPAVPIEVANEQDLVKELADLKTQLKQKKKELKAQTKAVKKALKAQKQKTAKSADCSSSSSSESESSDCECESADMKLLRTEQEASTESGLPEAVQDSVIIEATQGNPLSSDILDEESSLRSCALLSGESNEDYFRFSSKATKVAGKIEVCVGGKCKKAGSEQLLASLRGQIPRDSAVEAVPCKCMGKCKMSINVKVQKYETNPLHHSHVGIQDASLLLSHHFKLGPNSGLPSLGPEVKPVLAPQRFTTSF